jgi:curved DNA-binding protein
MRDIYTVLGVAKAATGDEIKRAYRRLASQHHPDKGGDTGKFQEIEEAYRILSDPAQRQQYDNPGPFGHNPAGGWQQAGNPFDFNNIFEMFGTKFQDPAQRSASARLILWVTLEDVATGGERVISVSTRQGSANVAINIVQGLDDGDTVRYAGAGPGGVDLVITFRIHPHVRWQRDHDVLVCDVVCDVWDLILGADITVITITGDSLSVVLPPNSQPGTMMRVRGHGMPRKNQPGQRSDMMLRIQAQIPRAISPDLLDRIRQERGK